MLPFIILLSTSLFSSSVQSQPHYPCNESFPLIRSNMVGNISHCKNLSTLGFQLGWNYHTTNTNSTDGNMTLDIIFSAKPARPGGWIAWGVNPGARPQMIGTRALIAFVSPSSSIPVVYTYNVTGETKLGCMLKKSALELEVVNARAYLSGTTGVITVAATLSLPASMYNITRLNHVWQVGAIVVGGDIPVVHAKRLENFDSREMIDLLSGHSVGCRRQRLRVTHGVLGVIGWGMFLPVGVIVARYYKGFPFQLSRWFLVHVGIQIIAFSIGTAAWGIGLSMIGYSEHYRSFIAHRIIGILVFFLASLQIVALWLKPSKQDKYRKYWSIYHHFIGYALIAFTVTNIFKGFAILRPESKWKWTYIGILACLGSITIGLEIVTWVKFFLPRKKDDKTLAPTTTTKA